MRALLRSQNHSPDGTAYIISESAIEFKGANERKSQLDTRTPVEN